MPIALLAAMPGCLIWPVHVSQDPNAPRKIAIESYSVEAAIVDAEETPFEPWLSSGGFYYDLFDSLMDRERPQYDMRGVIADQDVCQPLYKVIEDGRVIFAGTERVLETSIEMIRARNAFGMSCGDLVLIVSRPKRWFGWYDRPLFERVDAFDRRTQRRLWGATIEPGIEKIDLAHQGTLITTRNGWRITIGPRRPRAEPAPAEGGPP